jgi:hypothetical protein
VRELTFPIDDLIKFVVVGCIRVIYKFLSTAILDRLHFRQILEVEITGDEEDSD